MFSIFKESDFLWQNIYSQSWAFAWKPWHVWQQTWQSSVGKVRWQRWNRLPTDCGNWVHDGVKKYNAWVRASGGTGAEPISIRAILSSKMPTFCSLTPPETWQAEVAWWQFCRAGAVARRGQGYHTGDRVPGTCDGSSGIHILYTTPILRKNFRRTARSSGIRSNCIISHK